MNYIAGFALVVLGCEESAYWLTRSIVSTLLPGYFSAGLPDVVRDLQARVHRCANRCLI